MRRAAVSENGPCILEVPGTLRLGGGGIHLFLPLQTNQPIS